MGVGRYSEEFLTWYKPDGARAKTEVLCKHNTFADVLYMQKAKKMSGKA